MSQPATTPAKPPRFGDEVAYIAPMMAFLGLIWLASWFPTWWTQLYIARALLAGALLIYFRKQFTRIDFKAGWHWGVLFGVIGIVQWIGMEYAIQWLCKSITGSHEYWRIAGWAAPTNYFTDVSSNPAIMWSFILFRWIVGATLVVPIMEELFWRDYCWRSLIAPADFKLAGIGEWDWKPFIAIPLVFMTVHTQWITAFFWALMIAWLLVKTRSIGACIIAHAITNLLLGGWALYYQDWQFW